MSPLHNYNLIPLIYTLPLRQHPHHTHSPPLPMRAYPALTDSHFTPTSKYISTQAHTQNNLSCMQVSMKVRRELTVAFFKTVFFVLLRTFKTSVEQLFRTINESFLDNYYFFCANRSYSQILWGLMIGVKWTQ